MLFQNESNKEDLNYTEISETGFQLLVNLINHSPEPTEAMKDLMSLPNLKIR
jgi:hypothetical protein